MGKMPQSDAAATSTPAGTGDESGMAKVYTLYWQRADEPTADVRPIDGDFRQVYPIGYEFDPQINAVLLEDRTVLDKRWAYQGVPVDMTHAPMKAQYSGRSSEIADIMGASNWLLVTPKFRDVVESFEPGRHQFQPLELLRKDGRHIGQYFWFVPCARVDGMDRQHTTHPLYKERTWHYVPDGRYVVSLKQTEGHHVWIDSRLNSGPVFISAALHDALVQANLSGLGFGELAAV